MSACFTNSVSLLFNTPTSIFPSILSNVIARYLFRSDLSPSLYKITTTPNVHSSGNTPLSKILFSRSTKISSVFSSRALISSGIILSKPAALPFLKFAISFFLFLQCLFVCLQYRFEYRQMCCCSRDFQVRSPAPSLPTENNLMLVRGLENYPLISDWSFINQPLFCDFA